MVSYKHIAVYTLVAASTVSAADFSDNVMSILNGLTTATRKGDSKNTDDSSSATGVPITSASKKGKKTSSVAATSASATSTSSSSSSTSSSSTMATSTSSSSEESSSSSSSSSTETDSDKPGFLQTALGGLNSLVQGSKTGNGVQAQISSMYNDIYAKFSNGNDEVKTILGAARTALTATGHAPSSSSNAAPAATEGLGRAMYAIPAAALAPVAAALL